MFRELSMTSAQRARLRNAPKYALRPVPLWVYNPVFQAMIRQIGRRQPQLFRRLGEHCQKNFLIEPQNLPFVLLLQPDPARLSLRAYRSRNGLNYQVRISGSFLQLLRLLDSRLDSDAAFFSRDIVIEGDTEAVVCLRNALDDVEGSIASDVAGMFGIVGRRSLQFLRKIEA
jgi:predicted lipid carrier protein YhbT